MRDERSQASTGRESGRSSDRTWGSDRDSSERDRSGFFGRDRDEDRGSFFGSDRDRERGSRDPGSWGRSWSRSGISDRDYNPSYRRELWGSGDRDDDFGSSLGGSDRGQRSLRGGGYRPMTGDYSRSSGMDRGSPNRGGSGFRDDDYRSGYSREDRDQHTSFAGSSGSSRDRDFDPHYRSWRDRQISELDRDYDAYRRENRSRFEDDFGGWRERRQQKRGLLGVIREHMEVVGSDDQHVGMIDRVITDRIILTKDDPAAAGVHHSLSCSDVDRVEGERVILDCTADQARQRWRDESRSRALFEREDQGEMGPRVLDRSFEGTYRDR